MNDIITIDFDSFAGMPRQLILSLLILLPFMSCKSRNASKVTHVYSVEFGTYGGFTGAYDSYIFSGNGIFILKDSINTGESVYTLTDEQKQSTLAEIQAIIGTEKTYDVPGNMNQFIRIRDNGQVVYEANWAIEDKSVPTKVKTLYEHLNQFKEKKN